MFTKPFGKKDVRAKVALEKHQPLIHFALVCGAKSCPPIKTYSANVSIGHLSSFPFNNNINSANSFVRCSI